MLRNNFQPRYTHFPWVYVYTRKCKRHSFNRVTTLLGQISGQRIAQKYQWYSQTDIFEKVIAYLNRPQYFKWMLFIFKFSELLWMSLFAIEHIKYPHLKLDFLLCVHHKITGCFDWNPFLNHNWYKNVFKKSMFCIQLQISFLPEYNS